MKAMLRNPAVMAAIAAAILLVVGPGWWVWKQNATVGEKKAVAAQVAGVTQSLLLSQALRGGEGEAQELDKLVAAADGPIATLRGLPKRHDAAMVEAAETYMVDIQRVLRRQANLVRVRETTAASQNALMQHMAQATSRSDDWIKDAVALRQRLEKDFFEFKSAASAFASALDALPASRKALGEKLPGVQLYDEPGVGKLQTRAADDAKAATEELEALKRLPPPR